MTKTKTRVWLSGFTVFVLSGVTYAQSQGKSFEEAFRALKRETDLQFDMPDVPETLPPEPPRQTPEWLQAFYDFLSSIFSATGPILKPVSYTHLTLPTKA